MIFSAGITVGQSQTDGTGEQEQTVSPGTNPECYFRVVLEQAGLTNVVKWSRKECASKGVIHHV